MSASPAERTPGRTPGRTPNGDGPYIKRKPKAADPLVRPKKRPAPKPPTSNGVPTQPSNGIRPPSFNQPHQILQAPRPSHANLTPLQLSEANLASGWSSDAVAQFKDYPVVMSKKALLEGFRHHVAKFASKKNVDPRDLEEFVRPVRLHRKDPRATVTKEDLPEGEDSKEAEAKAIAKAERDAKREAESALVAPSMGGNKQRGINFKKTEQVYRTDQTEEQKARSKLRYEEALPWHLEDFDGKSTWVGTYEEALSNTYAMMIQGPDGVFRVVPLEKWYKFTQKNQFKTLSIEEAELRFNKKVKEPRWFMDSEEAKKRRQADLENKKAGSGLFLGKWERGGGGSGVAAPVTKHENADADDLDFTEDRFADDEENMLFEEDDETKEAEERIKKDQLQANVFGLKEEKEYDKQEQLEKKEKEEEKKQGKKVKKALMKREKNYIYDSDSGSNPYSSSSDSASDSTETERRKAAEEKEKEKAKDPAKSTPDKSPDKDKPKQKSKAPSSSGSRTPNNRPSKSTHPNLSRAGSSNNLKRPGSPLASDASGNESARSRKKAKKNKHLQPTAPQTNSKPPSRPSSPPIPPTTSNKRARAGSGSDNEPDAASGGEKSDGARKRQKVRTNKGAAGGSKPASPPASRGESPVPDRKGATSPTASSPLAQPPADRPAITTNAATVATTTTATSLPSPAEIRSKIPKEGIPMKDLLAEYKGMMAPGLKERFISLMKENAKFDKERKLLLPL
ncbi:uncharacterized protein KY384_005620 [Bacidia gigantensis]|uniref:uncharacterized protein n=1 Tax=Bacidia gigantensis TaxID=2732470 RepID=UPI001D05A941|nr:uncharacterized protein KY384_005620 [Bacidia gigantensis]KAG8530137.1 hypothetical protein KY384_005620 [Bacidia gigantensis]